MSVKLVMQVGVVTRDVVTTHMADADAMKLVTVIVYKVHAIRTEHADKAVS